MSTAAGQTGPLAPNPWLTPLALATAAAIAILWIWPGALEERPRRFAEVEPGWLYRGGYPEPDELRWLARRFGVRSVVSLMKDPPNSPREKAESSTVRELGLRFREIPMPGDGRGDFNSLDAAADAIADSKGEPVYVHCAAGRQRSNAALAAYRMRHCGWTFEQTLRELERFGLDLAEDEALVQHLRKYWESHLQPAARRAAKTP
ncbi:MAG: hypothetical protein L6Q92_07085 [Phycisphaerae bacterium]|nr:hypothetical protein [Phycisphaerae bacterium]